MNRLLSDKTAFVTGAARGLGKVIAERYLKDGARVAVFDANASGLGKTVNTWHQSNGYTDDQLIMRSGDVRNRDHIADAIAAVVDTWGRVDILANVAGIAFETHFLDIEPDEWKNIIDVNLTGVFNVAQLVAKQMVTQPDGGVIINMASKNGIAAEVKFAHYNASKAGVILLTKTMAIDLADQNIRVNAVAPGYIKTPMAAEIDPPEFMTFYKDRLIPLNRLGTPEDVAGAFAFLAGNDAKFITGHTLVIDGGQTSSDGRKLSTYDDYRQKP
ncbi:MAG: SDR family NAD(P)-dependent oxidoreductase [Rhodothermales bacterium]